MISGRTSLCGLIGDPVTHSLSPVIHNAAFADLELDYAYLAFCVKRHGLGEALAGLKTLGVRGLNVTIPHKGAVLPFLDELDDVAGAIGAVNTVVIENERLKGYNTDAPGFSRVLAEAGFNPTGKKVAVLGAGGAAAAAVYALAKTASEVVVLTRRASLEKGRALSLRFGPRVRAAELGKIEEVLTGTHLLVNTTSVGMSPNIDETLVPARLLRPGLTVFDAVYNPPETRLLREARAAGCPAISGLEMLLHQGALSFELWTGQSPSIDIMRRAASGILDGDALSRSSIALVGFMGSGKSAVGKSLAHKLGRRLLDTDKMVEKAAGKTVRRIFAEDGENAFRVRETVAVREAMKTPGVVISCGGGVILNAVNATLLRGMTRVVYLKASPQVILARTGRSRRRPLLQKCNKLKTISTLLSEREALYERAAAITVDTSNLSVDEVADAIIAAVKTS